MLKYIGILFLCLGGGLAAQPIVIDSTDMPLIGQVFVQSIADSLQEVLPGPGGENQVWDFRFLTATEQRENLFVDPTSLNFPLTFGDASVALRLPSGDSLLGFQVREAHQFFRTTDSTWEDIGTGTELDLLTFPASLRKDTADLIYRFPLTYGYRDSSYSSATFTIPFINLFYNTRQTRTTEADGWGSVQTPLASFETLRIISIIDRTDTISFGDTQTRIDLPILTEYKWLAKGEILPVLQINQLNRGDTLITLGTVSYKDTLKTTSRASSLNRSLQLYPNPTNQAFQIAWQQGIGPHAQIEIYSVAGKKLKEFPIDSPSMNLFVGDLPDGVYQG